MGKRQTYSEEKLLEAVVKYAEIHKSKIKATNLATWAGQQVEGLEGVRDYHFTRDITEIDSTTGEKHTRPKASRLKIDEINKSRNITAAILTNPLLKAANIDAFFDLPRHEQRKWILNTREQMERLAVDNQALRRKDDATTANTKAVTEQLDLLRDRMDQLKTKQEHLLKAVARAMDDLDANARKDILASIGITNGKIDLNTYADSLTLDMRNVFDMSRAIRGYGAKADQIEQDIENMIGEIDFDTEE